MSQGLATFARNHPAGEEARHWRVAGRMAGYPACCIEFFASVVPLLDQRVPEAVTYWDRAEHAAAGRILCPECLGGRPRPTPPPRSRQTRFWLIARVAELERELADAYGEVDALTDQLLEAEEERDKALADYENLADAHRAATDPQLRLALGDGAPAYRDASKMSRPAARLPGAAPAPHLPKAAAEVLRDLEELLASSPVDALGCLWAT
jgi:hypothetical protein